MESGRPPKSRVAVIGTGLAGLTTAHLLATDNKGRYEVTLFEQGNGLAFDSASVDIKNVKTGAVERLDLPMRALAGGYYANLLCMYEYLGIPIHPVRFLFVFAKSLMKAPARSGSGSRSRTGGDATVRPAPEAEGKVGSAPGTYFVHASNLHKVIPPRPAERGVLSHVVEILYLIVCQFWFTIACFLIRPGTAPGKSSRGGECETVSEYLERIWLPRRYVSHYLLPLMSNVSTCSHDELLRFPASDLVSYKKLSHGRQHYVVCGGAGVVQSRLSDCMNDIRLGARVLEVRPEANSQGVTVRWRLTKDGVMEDLEETFDRVVLAVSPDVTGRIFKPLVGTLGKIPTIQVESHVVEPLGAEGEIGNYSRAESHERPAPRCSGQNGCAGPAQAITFTTRFSEHGSRSEAVHTMPSGITVCTSPLQEPLNPKSTLHSAKFTRTLRTAESRAIVEKVLGESRRATEEIGGGGHQWVNGEDNVWLVGAWCWDGMVLLEGCVVSSLRVADDFGVEVPWRDCLVIASVLQTELLL
ncbi:uncharacterized protein DNG_07686 [Cephalotrichum gorgonifer]|uniref:Amine oxidase domain-containing protein n=1 Tax=Cephalotrichum gorgonifer TaxID=2041049 RepID=A0AAE8N238_9PEZI|nr:uncharacterized protein DNG_07686 [Cephalotrichum gorgonifer]